MLWQLSLIKNILSVGKCSSTFLVMVAENKKVRLSRGITFKILSTWQKKENVLRGKMSIQVIMLLHIKYREHYKMKLNVGGETTHLSLKVHVEDSVCFVHDQELESS